MKVGDLVVLVSDGPKMTVTRVSESGSVWCAWFEGKFMERAFPLECIKLVEEKKLKLFYYDVKHQQVYGSMEISENSTRVVNEVLEFLQDQLITDGTYKCLVVADDIECTLDGGEPWLVIKGEK